MLSVLKLCLVQTNIVWGFNRPVFVYFCEKYWKNANVSAWHLSLTKQFYCRSTNNCKAKPLETFFLISSIETINVWIKNVKKGFSSLTFDTSTVMSRTDKMHTWWVVHLVFVQTVKDIPNMNIVLDSRHKMLIKKLFGKVLTNLYTDLNSIFFTWWKLRALRKRYKTSFLAITFDLENRFLQRRWIWFRITKLQMKSVIS